MIKYGILSYFDNIDKKASNGDSSPVGLTHSSSGYGVYGKSTLFSWSITFDKKYNN